VFGNSDPVIIESPKQVEKNIDEQKKENALLQGNNEKFSGKPALKQVLEELKSSEYDNKNQKSIKKVADTERYPAKKKPLHFGN